LEEPLGSYFHIPAVVGKRIQISADEEIHTQQVASEQIHRERATNKVEYFYIF
jgi:hypothetical protein